MKKRFVSTVLLLAFVFGMGMPAAAYDGGYVELISIRGDPERVS